MDVKLTQHVRNTISLLYKKKKKKKGEILLVSYLELC